MKIKQKYEAAKKCIIVTAVQIGSAIDTIADAGTMAGKAISKSGQAVVLGTTITAISLFAIGCASVVERESLAGRSESPNELKRLAEDGHFRVRRVVAGNPKAPSEVLNILASDSDSCVRWIVAQNPGTPIELLIKQSRDSSIAVRHAIADNSRTPIDILITLATDSEGEVRNAIAANQRTPTNVLRKLSNDSNVFTRSAVAKHPNTPTDVLTNLYGDINGHIQANLATNPNTPPETLTKLSHGAGYTIDVARGLLTNPNTPPEVAENVRKGIEIYDANEKVKEEVRIAALKKWNEEQAREEKSRSINGGMREHHSPPYDALHNYEPIDIFYRNQGHQ